MGVLLAPVAYHYLRKPSEEGAPVAQAPSELRIGSEKFLYEFYLVDTVNPPQNPEMTPPERLKLSWAHLTRPFGVVVRFSQMPPNQDFQMVCTVEDSKGKQVETEWREPLAVRADATGAAWAYFSFTPNLSKHAPGTWLAKAAIRGAGEMDYKFTMADPTAEEKEIIANHEKAKNAAIDAFSHYWVMLPHPELKKTYVTATEVEGTGDNIFERLNLFQVAGLGFSCSEGFLSEADRLNGITYRGFVGFGFTMHRTYTPETRWGEWRDLNRPGNALQEGWRRLTGNDYADPKSSQQAPCMRYTVECRDGNWIVTSKERWRFINGVRRDEDEVIAERVHKAYEKEKFKKDLARWEERKKSAEREERMGGGRWDSYSLPASLVAGPRPTDPLDFLRDYDIPHGTHFSGNIFQPRLDVVAEIAEKGTTERDDLRELAPKLPSLRGTPKEQQTDTFKAVLED